MDISRIFIREQALAPVISYLNQTLVSMKRAIDTSLSGRGNLQGKFSVGSLGPLHSRDNSGQCSPGNLCPDGSCCNNDGGCGYGSENCGLGNCSSNCRHARVAGIFESQRIESDPKIGDATALCGKDSAGGKVSCPLNVCCSYYGYCGVSGH